MTTYAAALGVAGALAIDARHPDHPVHAVVFRAPTSGEYFAARGYRSEAIAAEGFEEITRIMKDRSIVKVKDPT